jgi:hypothetical protein
MMAHAASRNDFIIAVASDFHWRSDFMFPRTLQVCNAPQSFDTMSAREAAFYPQSLVTQRLNLQYGDNPPAVRELGEG